jgi:hypothetical protein
VDEQEGSRKQEAEKLKFLPIMWVKKKKLNGKVPVSKRDSKGHLYIVAEYDDTMKGRVIPDNQVVRAKNRRWFTQNKVNNFELKSTPCCPTYGVCKVCFSSGPVHMLCQKCKTKGHRYYLLRMNGVCGKILDAEWILGFFGTSHVDVRADKTQNWLTQKIWNVSREGVKAYIEWAWPARKHWREDDPGYTGKVFRLFMDGIEMDGAGAWDAIENPVEILKWDNPNMYPGDNDDDEY